MSELVIRDYAPSDWMRMCAIHDAARLIELRASAGEAAFLTLEQTFEAEGLFDGDVAVAELDDDLAGFVAWTDDALTWLYVDPGLHRRGIGRALLRYALAGAAPGFTTEVLVGNDKALALYLSEGFVIAEKVDGRLEGNEGFAASGYRLVRQG
jgi:GNAT superfamily N-acetyltransferase